VALELVPEGRVDDRDGLNLGTAGPDNDIEPLVG
jgi:hypothetical protein